MKKDYENICCRCSNTFITEDEEAIYCEECWNVMLDETLAVDGKDKKEKMTN